VAAELDDARPRYLHPDLSRNYTNEAWRSVLEEGECVTRDEQKRLTQLARRRDAARLRVEWTQRKLVIEGEITSFLTIEALPPTVRRRVISASRMLRAVDAELARI
jgi:hypothetical protein